MAEPKYYDELPTYIMHSDGEFNEGVFKAIDGSGNSLTIGTETNDTETKLTIEGADKAEFAAIFENNEDETETIKIGSFTATIGGIVFQAVGNLMSMAGQSMEGLAVVFKKDADTIRFTLPSMSTLAELVGAMTTRIERLIPNNIKDGAGTGAVVEGLIGNDVPAESRNEASGAYAHAEGGYTVGNGDEITYYHSVASGISSHAETRAKATGDYSHAEARSTASGNYSHGEGYCVASGEYSHVEGFASESAGKYSHAQNFSTLAAGQYSHAEGGNSKANGQCSHAEGFWSTADGLNSHSQNEYTIAKGKAQTVIGKYNAEQGTSDAYTDTDYAFIIGNGTGISASSRSNALAVRWDGAIVLANGTVLTVEQLAKVANLT